MTAISGDQKMSDASADKQRLPLQGVRVLELSHIVAGPSGGMILADLGADVIKIEHPATGDTARSQANRGGTFYTFNRNKKFLALDLRQPQGKKIFEKLVARSDIVLDNFVPGALARLGLGLRVGARGQPADHLLLGERFPAGALQRSSLSGRACANGRRARLPDRF